MSELKKPGEEYVSIGIKDAFSKAAQDGDFSSQPLSDIRKTLEAEGARMFPVHKNHGEEPLLRGQFMAVARNKASAGTLAAALEKNQAVKYAQIPPVRGIRPPRGRQ